MNFSKPTPITAGQLVLPAALVAFTLLLLGAFQLSEVLREHDSLHQAYEQQKTALENAKKVETQFTALALGVKKLAEGGDKDALQLVERMKQAGINFDNGATPATPPASTPPVETSP